MSAVTAATSLSTSKGLSTNTSQPAAKALVSPSPRAVATKITGVSRMSQVFGVAELLADAPPVLTAKISIQHDGVGPGRA